jgi:hypothetical protein
MDEGAIFGCRRSFVLDFVSVDVKEERKSSFPGRSGDRYKYEILNEKDNSNYFVCLFSVASVISNDLLQHFLVETATRIQFKCHSHIKQHFGNPQPHSSLGNQSH